jgi:FkbM family methyltransferase
MGLATINYENNNYSVEYADDFIYNEVLSKNSFFEIKLLEILRNKVKNFDLVLDIGANVGNHSFYFSNICNAKKIIAFEPDPKNCLIYRNNNPSSVLHQVALSDYNGGAYLNNSSPHNSGTGKLSSEGIEVQAATLDSFNLSDVTFIKIDVEGAELNVLKGMTNTITNSKPEILIEVHYGITIEDVLDILPIKYDSEFVDDYQYFLKPII